MSCFPIHRTLQIVVVANTSPSLDEQTLRGFPVFVGTFQPAQRLAGGQNQHTEER